ncbi:MAG TPA: fibronectin type III domain-containing protein [Acetobacteraceae bacterium]|nr:fibronectin type III domain-containing protein [Acetobacteraceae bacterium]
MPTISQLPAAAQITPADQVPISQSGSACSVNVGTLLAGTQPAIMIQTGSLFGRTSLGPGGPEPVAVGTGLSLSAATLAATGADHATFVLEGSLTLTDQAVLSSQGGPRLLPLALLRGLFSPGPNVAIDQNGTISASVAGNSAGGLDGYSISTLPTVSSIGANDLVAISQSGTDHTIPYADFVDGQTIDELPAAASGSDTDTFLVAQNGNVLVRQTMSEVWLWMSGKLATYQIPTLEITTNTTLNAASHNGHLLICSQPVTVTAAPTAMGSGFSCSVVNVSSGNVTLAGGIATSSGNPTLTVGQSARVICADYSGGTLVYASTSEPNSAASAPGQINGLTIGTVTSNSVALSWTPLSPSPTSYVIQYRITGTSSWSQGPSVSGSDCVVGSLSAATSYDFFVAGVNSAGAGTASAIVTAATNGTLSAPGQVTGLTAGNLTNSSILLGWSAPASGGEVGSYTVQYRISGNTSWQQAALGLTDTSFTMVGLMAATSYDFEVLAANAAGTGAASPAVTASTTAAGNSVTAITWNMVPSGSYTHAVGAIGVNIQVTPSNAPVQFGFSTSNSIPPTGWTAGTYVNTNLWGAYVNTPSTAGTWYAWAEGVDGSHTTVYPSAFTVT